jgi:hypothetical protein
MKKLTMGVIGCADFAYRAMIPGILESNSIELIAIASRSEQKALQFSKNFNCEGIVGYGNLLNRKDIDAVYMPLPTGLHEEWVLKALDANKHILIEKSFAMTYPSAYKMVKSAREKNLLIMENFLFPHHSQHAWVKNLIEQKSLGKIRLLRSTFGFPPFAKSNFRYNSSLGGGALLDIGTYTVKVSKIFLGNDIKILGATIKYDQNFGVDIYGDAMLKNSRGQIAQVSYGFNYHYQCHYELLGTQGKLTVERAFTPPPGFEPKVILESQNNCREIFLPSDNHYINMANFFADTIQKENDFGLHLDELLEQSRLLEEIHSMASGK